VETAKCTIFWVVKPCSLAEIQQRFGIAYCVHSQGGRESQSRLIAVWDSVVCYVPNKIRGVKMNAPKFPQNVICVGTSHCYASSETLS
jgi:hypothetical protein